MGTRAWPVFVAAALVGAAILAVLVVLPADGDAPGDADPAAAFLAAYERSRTGTFVVEERFTRTAPGGGELAYGRRLVQRPPGDRLVVGGGAAEGRLDGRVVRCATSPDGTSRCFEGDAAGPYDEEVAAEVASLRRLVDAAAPVYDLAAAEAGCFVLDLVLTTLPSPPYGERATFCFDDTTGAPTRFEVRRPEAVDVVVAEDIRTTVEPADLRPGDLGDLPT